jgi:CO dehydrogenase/acetyl-CoA synthase epsilon subunit
MEKFIELELELRDGGSYYLCDSRFVVMSGSIKRPINAIEYEIQHYSSVNGIAVKHTYEESVEMIRKARESNNG